VNGVKVSPSVLSAPGQRRAFSDQRSAGAWPDPSGPRWSSWPLMA